MPIHKAAPAPEMLRGSVITHRRRCGKANCRCAGGEQLHESTVLSYSQGSKTRFVMLPEAEVQEVRQAMLRYKAAKASLEERAEASLKELITRLKRQKS